MGVVTDSLLMVVVKRNLAGAHRCTNARTPPNTRREAAVCATVLNVSGFPTPPTHFSRFLARFSTQRTRKPTEGRHTNTYKHTHGNNGELKGNTPTHAHKHTREKKKKKQWGCEEGKSQRAAHGTSSRAPVQTNFKEHINTILRVRDTET